MKKILIGALVFGIGFMCMAQDRATFQCTTVKNGVASTASSSKLDGFVEALYVVLPAGNVVTASVVVATAQETIYSATLSATTLVRPRVVIQDTAGATVTAGTNNPERVYLYGDILTATITETSAGSTNKVVPVTVWLSE